MSRTVIIGLAGLTLAVSAATSNAAVIINEVYPGGGSGVATTAFTRDYVELYNNGATAFDLSNYRVTYASASGNFGTNDLVKFGAGSYIGAGDTLLIVTGGAGTAGAPIVGANYYNGTTGGASLSGTAGSVTLISATGVQLDTVGFGTTVTSTDANGLLKVETAAAPAPTSGNATSLSRTLFADTNNNSVDFTNGVPTPTPGINSFVAVPEPTTLAAAGLSMLLLRRRRA